MTCPSCSKSLQKLETRGIEVDACSGGCGGIWFDQRELDAFDSAQEAADAGALIGLRIQAPPPAPSTEPRPCPKCVKYKMQKRFSCIKRAVEIDSCPGCGGIWLDPGELIRIQALWKTDADRARGVEEFFTNDIMPQFQAERERLQRENVVAKIERAIGFVRISKFFK